jgi:hypothetical protein
VPDEIHVADVVDVTDVRRVLQVLHMRNMGQVIRMRPAHGDGDGGRGHQATVLERFHDARRGGAAAARFRCQVTEKHIHL